MNRFDGEQLAGFIHKPARAKAVLAKIAEVTGRSPEASALANEA